MNKIEELHLDGTDCRIEAENLVTWSMHILKTKSKKIVSEFNTVKNKIKDRLIQVENVPMQDVRTFIDLLCGHSYHTSWTEPFFYLDEPFITIPNNNVNIKMLYKQKKNEELLISINAESNVLNKCSNNSINVKKEPIILNELGQAVNIFKPLQHKGIGQAWDCNYRCKKYDPDIALELYNMFKNLHDCKIPNLIQYLQDITACSVNSSINKLGHSHGCYIDPTICTSRLLPLKILSSHFPILRSIQKRIYTLNNLCESINNIDQALNNSDYQFLRKTVEDAKVKTSSFPGSNNIAMVSENYINLKFKKAIKKFTEISSDLPKYVCYSCEKLCCLKNVKNLEKYECWLRNSQVWKMILDLPTRQIDKEYVCNYCFDKIRIDIIPSTSVINNLFNEHVPDELKLLNETENMLISRARSFQTIKTLTSVMHKNQPNKEKIKKVVGTTFHLPLPLEKTIQKICHNNDPINLNPEFYIVVRSIPNKNKQIWENLVDVKQIMNGLEWLKNNNHLYAEIKLPANSKEILDILNKIPNIEHQEDEPKIKNLDDIDEGVVENNDHENLNEANNAKNVKVINIKENHNALLTLVTQTAPFYEDYTIFPIRDIRTNETATNLYQQVFVHDIPLYRTVKYLDAMCFPLLYPTGKNTQHADRPVRLRDCDFITARLNSSDPRYRRNAQYLFHLQHDCNQRQLDGGIFQVLNLLNPKEKYTKGSYLNKLKNNELENRLDNIYSRVRNSPQFWKPPMCMLNAMIRYYGPATFFLTLSPSEWMDSQLYEHLREINSDIDTTKMTLSELIALDPVSTARYMENKFKAMLAFICSDDHPIGEVQHYFWRREYQQRGMVR